MAPPQRTPGKSKATNKVQQIKLITGLKKISTLNLTPEKIDFFSEKSIFSSLTSIKNGKESSATLMDALSSFYDKNSNSFRFNEKSFSFCAREVAAVLDIPMGNQDFSAFKSELVKSRDFPDFLYELRKKLVGNVERKKDISAQDMKIIMEKMEIGNEEEKQLFVQLLSYYYIEQFALCGTKIQNPRYTRWTYVSDMEKFNKVDWPTAIHEHLMDSISEAHKFIIGGRRGQNTFKGCAPILEAILFQRLHKSYSGSMSTDLSPPVQIYNAQRRTADEWKSLLLGCEITECGHCPSPVSTDEGASESPKRSTPSADTPSSSPPTSPSHNPIPLERHLLEEVCESVSALQLIPEEEGRGRGGRKGKVVPPPRAKSERERKQPEWYVGT